MKTKDIVNQIKAILPKYTNDFTSNNFITSLTRSGSTVTAITSSPHNLAINKLALINGAKTPILIDSLTQKNGVAIAITNTEHNLYKGLTTTEISGANQAQYNGIKTIITPPILEIESISILGNIATVTTVKDHGYLVNSKFNVRIFNVKQSAYNKDTLINSIPTPKTFTYTVYGASENAVNAFGKMMQVQQLENSYVINFSVDNSALSPATGIIYQLSNYQDGYNGYKTILTVPTPTSFTYLIDSSPLSPAQGTISVRNNPTVSGAINLDMAIAHFETEFISNQNNWIYVIAEDEVTSRNNKSKTDAISYAANGYALREQNIQMINVYLFLRSQNELLHSDTRDKAVSYKQPLCKALLGFKAPSVFTDNLYSSLLLINNGSEIFNQSYYVHRFTFEATNYYTNCDAIEPSDLSAFRVFDFELKDFDNNTIALMGGLIDQNY